MDEQIIKNLISEKEWILERHKITYKWFGILFGISVICYVFGFATKIFVALGCFFIIAAILLGNRIRDEESELKKLRSSIGIKLHELLNDL